MARRRGFLALLAWMAACSSDPVIEVGGLDLNLSRCMGWQADSTGSCGETMRTRFAGDIPACVALRTARGDAVIPVWIDPALGAATAAGDAPSVELTAPGETVTVKVFFLTPAVDDPVEVCALGHTVGEACNEASLCLLATEPVAVEVQATDDTVLVWGAQDGPACAFECGDPGFCGVDRQAAERCDGLDNDCDGAVDEGLADACGQGGGGGEGQAECVEGEREPCAGGVHGRCAQAVGLKTCQGGVWGACEGAVEPAPERCDLQDNDCDAITDEGFVLLTAAGDTLDLGAPCPGTGTCGDGNVVCHAGQEVACCSTDIACGFVGRSEDCDGVDNDCDGHTDELPLPPPADDLCLDRGVCEGVGPTCEAGGWRCAYPESWQAEEASCDGLDNDCDGAVDLRPSGDPLDAVCFDGPAEAVGVAGCRAGHFPCEGGSLDDRVCVGQVPPQPEACDGLDNDCDGEVDEDAALRAAGIVGAVCGDDEGTCRTGLTACEDQEVVCAGQTPPADSDLCDGLDEDCDGSVDEDVAGDPTLGEVCEVQGQCGQGTVECSPDRSRRCCSKDPECFPDVDLARELCNGVDDDCDGDADEAEALRAHGVTGLACGGDEGQCASGLTGCRGGQLACLGEVAPTDEDCDDLDNDCDGSTDEAADLRPPPADRSEGLCRGQVQVCGGPAGWQEPDYRANIAGYEVRERSCDGVDNDCDGTVDEATHLDDAPPAATRAGVCGAAVKVCRGVQGWREPNAQELAAQVGAAYETTEASCDGVDNDCDGAVDEPGDLEDAPPAQAQNGACAGAVRVCRNGAWRQPNAGELSAQLGATYETQEHTCDGVDNDCDGAVDEGEHLDDPPSAAEQDGVCAGAVRLCRGARGWGEPNAGDLADQVGASYEAAETSCDGLDNDCDGGTDEGEHLEAGPSANEQDGVCAGATQVCRGGVWGEPDAADLAAQLGAAYENPETSCDGLNNDCDALLDEPGDLVNAPPAAEQDGACEGAVKVCRDGDWQEPAASDLRHQFDDYIAVEVICDDGVDNDCDGHVDMADSSCPFDPFNPCGEDDGRECP